MAQPQKFRHVMSVIERRIREGDYLLTQIPGERKIAEETGVSHMTARKAVRELLNRKVLIRRPNGLLDIFPGYQTQVGQSHVVLLYPAYPSVYLLQLRQTITQAAEQYGLGIRPVQYVHWDDPVFSSAVSNPAGLILLPSSDDVPNYVLESLRSSKTLAIDMDLSEQGIPSIRLFPDRHIIRVFEYLRKLGHQKVSCISTQYHNPEVHRRIRLWREWLERHELTGDLLENPTRSFGDATQTAYELMSDPLAKGPLQSTAYVGTTFPAAVGASRACWEHSLQVGKDVSICAINIESPSRFMTPSVTGLDTPKISELLRQSFDWFSSDQDWVGSKRLEPNVAEFVRGESTREAPRRDTDRLE